MIRFFAGHPTAALLLGFAFLFSGVMSLPGLQRATFPDFQADRVEIRAVYPGASAGEVEEAICQTLEDALDGTSGIAELVCTARAGVGIAVIELVYGRDVGRMLTDVKTAVDAIDSFPPEVERPLVRQLDVTEHVVSLAITGPMSAPALRTLAEEVKARLRQVPGVAAVEIGGFSERRIEVELDDVRLRALGLSAAAVAAAIERQSLDLPAGTVETGERDILVRFLDRRRTVAELERIVVREAMAGGTVRLGEIATIREGFVDPVIKTVFDGERAAMLDIRRNREDDVLRVRAAIGEFVDAERARLPATVTLAFSRDTSPLIADRLTLLARNALQGFLLICLVLWSLFSIRFSLTVAAALPLSLAATVFVMNLLGYNLNLITTVGLLIAVGLLIDSAIVVNENVARHAERGAGVIEAATRGAGEVSGAVISSFVTSVAIFGPLAFLEGNIGRVLQVLPVVLIISLTASLVVSFLVLPFFTARAMVGARRGRLRARIDAGFDAFRNRLVGALVRMAVSWRYATLGLVLFLFLATLSLLAGGVVKFQAFPDVEGDIVEARLMLTPGTPLARTEAAVAALVAALERVAAASADGPALVEQVTAEFARNADYADQGPHLATVRADLTSSEAREARVGEVLEGWRAEAGPLTDVVSLTFREPAIGPAGKAVEIRLQGSDLEQLRLAGAALAAMLNRYAGVVGITTDMLSGADEIHLRLREGALRLGLDAATVAAQLRTAFHGVTADEMRVGRETVRLDLRHDAAWRGDLGRLDDFAITLDDGRRVPLSAVAEVDYGRGIAYVRRIDGRRALTVEADVDTGVANANEVLAAVDAAFRRVLAERFPGVDMAFAGQRANQAETAASMQAVFVIGLAAMFVTLSFQFRSYVEPLIVMVSIPLALTGVVAGHLVMGLDMSMPSMVGFVSLAGIVVNNSILLVAFIRSHLDAGSPIAAAAAQASLDRFRAIFMTTATTVAGLVPLLFETSVQAQVLIPLVTSLAFGLVAATVLVLFLTPALYMILHDLRGGWPWVGEAAA